MSAQDAAIAARAAQAGLAVEWTDVAGRDRRVPSDVLAALLERLPAVETHRVPPLLTTVVGQPVVVPNGSGAEAVWHREGDEVRNAVRHASGGWCAPAEPGYWIWQQGAHIQRVAVAPQRAWYPTTGTRPRHWGLAAQVYSLRQAGDAGIGDSSGCLPWLQRLADGQGAALALSPIHAAMPIGEGYSPYSPSDRTRLEPVHAAPLQILPEAAAAVRAEDPELDARLTAHERTDRIDWPTAAADKQAWIQRLPGWLQRHDPVKWRRICSDIQAAGDRVDAEGFGQWLARGAWRSVQQRAVALGLPIGLIADLAVGFDPAGEEAARHRDAILTGLQLGAPPDAFNPLGQAWGITGYAPQALRQQGYAPFIALLRAVMADRGGLRIDHILGLNRLWVAPQGSSAAAGAYLEYPFEDLINLLVLESWHHRCIVIGEDLGVVPPGIRATLAARGILGIDVLAFSRDEQGFWPPSRWRSTAVAMTSTHDLPPLAGWRAGNDLRWQYRLGWIDAEALQAQQVERAARVDQLADLARAQGVAGPPEHAAIALTARSPAALALLPLEDALDLHEQPNLPGTVQEHPNWQQRLPEPLPESVDERLRSFAAERSVESAT